MMVRSFIIGYSGLAWALLFSSVAKEVVGVGAGRDDHSCVGRAAHNTAIVHEVLGNVLSKSLQFRMFSKRRVFWKF